MSLATSRRRRTRARLPLSYFVPGGGLVQRRRVHDRHQLRGLRTELALLGRIDSLVTSGLFDDYPVNERKYGQADREELSDIIRSAADPIVRSMIDVVDREFGSVREEIMMAVVQDEAERIVAEAAESGTDLAAPAEPGFPPKPAADSPPEPVAGVATPSEPIPAELASSETEPSRENATDPAPADPAESVDEVARSPTTRHPRSMRLSSRLKPRPRPNRRTLPTPHRLSPSPKRSRPPPT